LHEIPSVDFVRHYCKTAWDVAVKFANLCGKIETFFSSRGTTGGFQRSCFFSQRIQDSCIQSDCQRSNAQQTTKGGGRYRRR
jgi:hypothetical protein